MPLKKGKKVKSASPGMPSDAQEAKWKAENDARTLAEAETVKADMERMKMAKKAAQTMVKDKRVEAMAWAKIAAGKLTAQQKFEKMRLKQGAKRY